MLRRQKALITHLTDPNFYAEKLLGEVAPYGMLAGWAVGIRTVLRGKLSLLIDYARNFFILDTDIPSGVPPCVRANSEYASGMILRCIDHDEAALDMGLNQFTFFDWRNYVYSPARFEPMTE
jgi:hypothetical protein